MIGKIKGRVEHLFDDHCFIEVSGICYVVFCSSSCLKCLTLGQNVSFFIHTMVKDDLQVLFGFESNLERELFILLTSIQGVGGKMAINLLGEIAHDHLIKAIQQENPKVLQQVSGIGSKIALRIINELKGNKKLFSYYVHDMTATPASNYDLKQDALSALMNLGFKRADVSYCVDNVFKELGEEATLEVIIRNCISKLTK